MATTEAGICNIALARVGNRHFIDALTDATMEAQVCAVHYAEARDAVLASTHWRFAARRAQLAEVSGETRSGWEYVYALPTNCIAPRYIWTGARAPAASGRIPFDIEDDADNGTLLLTDQESAELVYTHRVTVVPRFAPLFVQALAWRLAMDLALALPVKPQVGLAMQQGYRAALAEAIAAELNSVEEDPEPDSDTITVR